MVNFLDKLKSEFVNHFFFNGNQLSVKPIAFGPRQEKEYALKN